MLDALQPGRRKKWTNMSHRRWTGKLDRESPCKVSVAVEGMLVIREGRRQKCQTWSTGGGEKSSRSPTIKGG